MKQKLESLLLHAVETLKTDGILERELKPQINIERARDQQHGDFATNLAMILCKQAKMNPRQLAEKIIAILPADEAVTKVELAGPGFINFFIDPKAQYQIISTIHDLGNKFGLSQIGAGKKVQVEFVSANPTGPLHVGHGRGAAYGSAVADLLTAAGFEVEREYYVNDAGRQMDILTASVWLRYLEECGEVLTFPSNGYRGDYIREIAANIHRESNNEYRHPVALVFEEIPADEPQGGDKDKHIDALIARAKTLLGTKQYHDVFQAGLNEILADIRMDLSEFGVDYQQWFSERQLMDDGSIDQALTRLREAGHLYEKEGATWFASSQLGDEKDRVVIRENGQSTYFASDIAYHMNKLDRGFDQIINIWGADHHGYIPRVKAAMQALGADTDKLKVLLVQFAVLYRGGEQVQMSTRSGSFVTLRQLRNEVGLDAARFFYVMRKSEQHMDFDLKLATSKTNENPVFYVQYAHARVCSVLKQLAEKGLQRDIQAGAENLDKLTEEQEIALVSSLTRYPEVLERAAVQYEPHLLINYLRELAAEFHTYYNAHQFIVDDVPLRNARLNLIYSVKQVLANGLNLLRINTPEAM
ncbi:arginyl-tRNA synthetase [Bathymodiolus platifrons methanotrophic gill symbiont]|uniref:arginine--tRNA ligase n=1 Tax=Bathymodiolus platifrons methanotrophic gill symbiont TaxID=113268 RepID=UPI0011C881CB|nr:arginine--tRNA ligase [Bathymodiolus platifrons methanotrophic gill symbiont]TXK96694.1 arginine--tRNA ligase [Methylococcaceae bacterium HT1]TXL23074.1 arginine--tRNA ligase [Methylococcaceae bacterium HT2]GFO77368.1 arginyl-tRNA synthetase [Bathymodiolus platifrons methanotrophic gill symbiont]